ncbi:DNA-binding response regulator, partial [Parafrankia sp. BMG5.11]
MAGWARGPPPRPLVLAGVSRLARRLRGRIVALMEKIRVF